MRLYTSRFQILMSARHGYDIIQLSAGDDFGLYLRRWRSDSLRTALAARGARAEIAELLS